MSRRDGEASGGGPSRHVLVTGGAGFVGSHLVDALLERGHRVRVLDNLDPQVHPGGEPPPWLASGAELVRGDVRDRGTVLEALADVDVVYHLAAAVGVGQSMYEISRYMASNTQATADLMQLLVDEGIRPERLVVASSMSVYGEGRYRSRDGAEPACVVRERRRLEADEWEPVDDRGQPLQPRPTDEDKPQEPTSVYALSKADQEVLCLRVGEAYGIPAVALRFFNVYGPRQALSNPYTGVMAIFSSRLLNGKPPLVFEDGAQSRDFVSVHDVVQALLLAMERDEAVGRAVNVGSGRPVTVRSVAEALIRVLDADVEPDVTGRYRVGDVRHCFADIGRARRLLGYEPEVSLEDGLQELVEWLASQERPRDRMEEHARHLDDQGLTV